jgi:hypothetical protein
MFLIKKNYLFNLMERILARNSDNISKLINLMTTHEYNVRNYCRNNRNIDIQLVFDRLEFDLSNNVLNRIDISNQVIDISNVTYKKFEEIENQNETVCPITQETFAPEDNVALLRCGHYFKKDAFLVWGRRSTSCPSCRAAFR